MLFQGQKIQLANFDLYFDSEPEVHHTISNQR
jgi:hypothetical protein